MKRAVTHEDPGAYHLIYGDEGGSSCSRLSFFFFWLSAAAEPRSDGCEHVSLAIAPEAMVRTAS